MLDSSQEPGGLHRLLRHFRHRDGGELLLHRTWYTVYSVLAAARGLHVAIGKQWLLQRLVLLRVELPRDQQPLGIVHVPVHWRIWRMHLQFKLGQGQDHQLGYSNCRELHRHNECNQRLASLTRY